MTKQEMILFGEAITLLRKSKFHFNKDKDKRDVVVEKIQELLCIHGLDMLAEMYKNDEKTN
jgi:hypothetical protein